MIGRPSHSARPLLLEATKTASALPRTALALLILACNGRLAVLDPPLTNPEVDAADSLVQPSIDAGAAPPEMALAFDAGQLAPPLPVVDPRAEGCTCTSSAAVRALGCDKYYSGIPVLSDDGQVAAFELCNASSVCRPYRWTEALGVQALPAPSDGAAVAAISPDGDLVLLTPKVTFGTEAIVYRASDGSTARTGLRPAPAVLSADGSVVGLTVTTPGSSNLARWTREAGIEVLGELPIAADNVLLVGTPEAAVIAGMSRAQGSREIFRWTPGGGLAIGDGLPEVSGGWPIVLSRDGSALLAYHLLGGGQTAFRWTEAGGLVELGLQLTDVAVLGASADASVVAGTRTYDQMALCGAAIAACDLGAVRWTDAEGAVALTPGTPSWVSALSLDGSVAVGQAGAFETALFDWNAQQGARNTRMALEAAGADLSGWVFAEPRALSRNGKVVLGYGTCGTGSTVYRVVLPD